MYIYKSIIQIKWYWFFSNTKVRKRPFSSFMTAFQQTMHPRKRNGYLYFSKVTKINILYPLIILFSLFCWKGINFENIFALKGDGNHMSQYSRSAEIVTSHGNFWIFLIIVNIDQYAQHAKLWKNIRKCELLHWQGHHTRGASSQIQLLFLLSTNNKVGLHCTTIYNSKFILTFKKNPT